MRRDQTLIAELLCKLEDVSIRPGGVITITPDADVISIEGCSVDEIAYHLDLIAKSGLIDPGGFRPMVGIGFRALTPAGHDLADGYRRSKIMRRDTGVVKNLLDELEAKPGSSWKDVSLGRDDEETKSILFHLGLMKDEGLISGISVPMRGITVWQDLKLTSKGHEYLESFRSPKQKDAKSTMSVTSNKIFLVHGHDDEAKQTVARFLERLGFEVIILHEQTNRGSTIIEKFERNSDVAFAVILLTPDDEGGLKGGAPSPRARQNVVLEWGFFIGRLGRGRVCALRKENVELPSDLAGIIWESLDDAGAWKVKLASELQDAGLNFDWAKLAKS